MYIYNYDEKTKEYKGKALVDFDPAEKEKGRIVPLVPANATLTAPPEYDSFQEIPVLKDSGWVIMPDYRKNFYSVDEFKYVAEITEIGNLKDGLILVDKVTGEKIKENPDKFKIVGAEVIELTEEEYEAEKTAFRQSEFEQQFFLTSLGYIRRSVNMATGETKDFICDIVPALQAGLAQGIATPIITYELPDFTKELTTEYLESLQEVKSVTAEFLQECIMQLANDFMPQGLNVGVNDEGVNEGEEAKTPADTETVKKDDQESEEETTI